MTNRELKEAILALSPSDQDKVSAKISKLVGEGKPQDQAVAIAYSMLRSGKLADPDGDGDNANSPNPDTRARSDGDSDDDDAMREFPATKKRVKKANKAEELNPKKLQPAKLSDAYLSDFYDLSRVQIKLSGQDPDVQATSWVPVFPEGTFHHPEYGELVFDATTIPQYIDHFDSRVRHIDIAVDVDHRNEEAVGWVKRLDWRRGVGLFGLVEWNRLGQQKLQDKQYRYISAQFGDYKDEQTGEITDNVISALTITNFPFLKRMTAIQLSERDRLRDTFRRLNVLHKLAHEGSRKLPTKLHKQLDLWLEGRTLKGVATDERRLSEGRAILAQYRRFSASMGPTSGKSGGSLPHEKQDFDYGDNADEGGPALDEGDADLDDGAEGTDKNPMRSGFNAKRTKRADDGDESMKKSKKAKRAALLAQLAALDDDAEMDDSDLDDDEMDDDSSMKKSKKAYDQDDAYGEAANMEIHKKKSAQKTYSKGQVPGGADGSATGRAEARPVSAQTQMSERGTISMAEFRQVQKELAETRRELRKTNVQKQLRELQSGSLAYPREVLKRFREIALADKAQGEQLFEILNFVKDNAEFVQLGERGSAISPDEDAPDVLDFKMNDSGDMVVGMTLSNRAKAYAKEHQLDWDDSEDRLMAMEAVTIGGAEDGDKRPARAKGWK